MSVLSSSELKPGAKIADKYAIDRLIDTESERIAFVARAIEGEQVVLGLEISASWADALRPGLEVEHAHLSKRLALLELESGSRLLLVELIMGTTLEERLLEIEKKTPVDAVRSALRVTDAVSALHQAGAAHGGIQAGALFLDPVDRDGPILSFCSHRAPKEFSSPERRAGGAPSEADDTWATGALLYLMLSGSAPDPQGFEGKEQLEELGVDEALRTTLAEVLCKDSQKRVKTLRPMKRELARWFVHHAGEEQLMFAGSAGPSPPPLPPSSSPPGKRAKTTKSKNVPPVSASTTPASTPRRRVPLMAVVGITLGLGAAWAVSAMAPEERLVVARAVPAPAPSPSASEKSAIDLGDVPVTGEKATLTGDKTATCLAAYLPPGALDKPPDMSFLCSTSDPRIGAQKLRVAVIEGAPQGPATKAMKLFSLMGWYDMAAFAVMRSGCCIEPQPLSLPDPPPACGRMDEQLTEIGRAVVANQSYDDVLKRYLDTIHCEVNAGRGAVFHHKGRPQGGEETAFRELVAPIQQP